MRIQTRPNDPIEAHATAVEYFELEPRTVKLMIVGLDLIRFGGRVSYVDLVSSSFIEESLQGLGGVRISIRRSVVAADEHPVAI